MLSYTSDRLLAARAAFSEQLSVAVATELFVVLTRELLAG